MEVEKAYNNIENIITYGFLFKGICYKDNAIILKTISDKEYRLISFYSSDKSDSLSLLRLAFSTFMINGNNLLVDRNKNITDLTDFYKNISITVLATMLTDANNLHNEYLESLNFMEGFCYTDRSRALWSIYRGFNNFNFYGIEGSDKLGINSTQESWIAINHQLDSEEEYNREFRLSLMVASSMNSKGCKKIESQYDFHKNELEELRKEISKYGYDKNRVLKKKEEKDGWAVTLRTREDIVRELNREMSGGKDKHDVFIDNWIKEQKDKAEEAKRLSEEKQKSYRDKINKDIDFTKMEGSRIATPEEVKRIMSKKVISGIAKPSDPLEKKFDTEEVIRKVSGTVIKSN